jgi:hypothetical protein
MISGSLSGGQIGGDGRQEVVLAARLDTHRSLQGGIKLAIQDDLPGLGLVLGGCAAVHGAALEVVSRPALILGCDDAPAGLPGAQPHLGADGEIAIRGGLAADGGDVLLHLPGGCQGAQLGGGAGLVAGEQGGEGVPGGGGDEAALAEDALEEGGEYAAHHRRQGLGPMRTVLHQGVGHRRKAGDIDEQPQGAKLALVDAAGVILLDEMRDQGVHRASAGRRKEMT